jgi:hypothetical protein
MCGITVQAVSKWPCSVLPGHPELLEVRDALNRMLATTCADASDIGELLEYMPSRLRWQLTDYETGE